MTTTTTRPSKNPPRAAGRPLHLENSGELRVAVTPPSSDMPEGIRSIWYSRHERPHYVHQTPPAQQVQVTYEIYSDRYLLDTVTQRSLANRSGNSVRGPVRAEHGRIVDLGLSPSYIASKVRRAANQANGRTTDGPISVRIKLLEQPNPVPAICSHCKQPALAHVREEQTLAGSYEEVPGQRYRQWNPDGTHTEVFWWCPSN